MSVSQDVCTAPKEGCLIRRLSHDVGHHLIRRRKIDLNRVLQVFPLVSCSLSSSAWCVRSMRGGLHAPLLNLVAATRPGGAIIGHATPVTFLSLYT